jgi:hypothetical protein
VDPVADFIRPFGYNEWEGWDGESGVCTTKEFLDGCGGGDEMVGSAVVSTLHGSARFQAIGGFRFRRITRFSRGGLPSRHPCRPRETDIVRAVLPSLNGETHDGSRTTKIHRAGGV